jgi:hypothetical protein
MKKHLLHIDEESLCIEDFIRAYNFRDLCKEYPDFSGFDTELVHVVLIDHPDAGRYTHRVIHYLTMLAGESLVTGDTDEFNDCINKLSMITYDNKMLVEFYLRNRNLIVGSK